MVTGVPVARVERLARDFANIAPSLAIVGGPPLAHTNGLFTALAVNALNSLVGAVEQPGGIYFTPQVSRQLAAAGGAAAGTGSSQPPQSVDKLAADILAAPVSPVKVLLVDTVNPVFASPAAWKVREAFEKIPFIVSVGSFVDETSALADLILPDSSFLESWADALPESGSLVGVASLAPPTMRPLHETRPIPDVILEVGRRLQKPVELPWQTYDEMLMATFSALPPAPGDEDPWGTAQRKGGWWGTPAAAQAAPPAAAAAPAVRYEPARFDGDATQYPFYFLPYASAAFLDGSLAHLPWLQELPDPLTSAMWSTWIEINPRTAERLGIADRDLVEVASAHGSLRAAAILSPGIAPEVIAMPAGQGHRTFTRYASGRGENPLAILAPVAEAETGALAWAATRVKVSRVGGRDARLILFAGGMREEPHEGQAR
jgi:anaerobic selenocysteine-containing dehydrogenase